MTVFRKKTVRTIFANYVTTLEGKHKIEIKEIIKILPLKPLKTNLRSVKKRYSLIHFSNFTCERHKTIFSEKGVHKIFANYLTTSESKHKIEMKEIIKIKPLKPLMTNLR